MLLKSEKIVTTTKQLTLLFIYGAFLSLLLLFPWNNPMMGISITIDEVVFSDGATILQQSSPNWSLPYYLYVVVILTLFASAPSLYLTFKVYQQFEDQKLRKKWKVFIVGLLEIYVFTYSIITSNLLNIPALRTLMGLIGIILALTGAYAMYYGVGKKI